MKIKTYFLAILAFALTTPFLAQEEQSGTPQCKTKAANESLYLAKPDARIEYQKFNKFTNKFVQDELIGQIKTETYTIPVVVHVYGIEQNGKTVNYSKVKKALDVLNEEFNGLNEDWNTIDPVFDGSKSTLNIKFALAKIDPHGGSTNGVIIHPAASGQGVYNSPIVAADGWDNYKYMNVYIAGDLYGDGNPYSSGVAWYPDTSMSDEDIARVVYNGQYLHGNTNDEFASVFTHEFGHWLNLIHTFQGGCDDAYGDMVDDTPIENSSPVDQGCTVGAFECGNLINYENYMGYESSGGCAKMFTIGQTNRMLAALQHDARRPLWQPSNLIATGVNLEGASLITSNGTVLEAMANNGTLEDSFYDIDIDGGTFSLSSGTLIEGTHYTASLPQGFSPNITVISNTKLRLKFNGSTVNHAAANNDFGKITLKDTVISGGTEILNSDNVSFNFVFYDPYKVVYVDNEDYTANADNDWTFFRIEGADSNDFGTFYENNKLMLETYKKALVCNPDTKNPIPIAENTVISSTSSWVDGGAYPDLHVIRDDNYTDWDGKTAYIGFQLVLYSGKVNYGWFRVQMNANGTSYTLLDYAYSTEPFGPIKAGSKVWGGDTEPTCDDGIQNGDETGIDCGGSCEPCQTEVVYCDANASSSLNEYISRVQLGTIDKNSAESIGGYSDYTSESTDLSTGVSNTITITPMWTETTYNEAYSVWIDYNKDGDFSDMDELVWSQEPTQNTPVSGIFTVPSTATSGTTRMRIIMRLNTSPSSCGTFDFGEVEDYSINIKAVTTPTCDDGIQNGDETGVDCGGSCEPCEEEVVYCDANASSSVNEYISNVQLGSINNSSTASGVGYSDYTSVSTELYKGDSNIITITPAWSGTVYTEAYAVWIDYNKDGEFSDFEERVWGLEATRTTPVSGTFTIPHSAQDGNTRMRVIMRYNTLPSPCRTFDYGEVEDYTVIIKTKPTCDDGIQNGDETGVDCGGSFCEPCEIVDIYCNASSNSSYDEFISRVQIGTIDKNSEHSDDGYSDFTSESTILPKGEPNTITITPKWIRTVYDEAYAVWIDYNQDGQFSESEEQVWSKAATQTTPVSGTFTVPDTALDGVTRLRVIMRYSKLPYSCGTFDFGEVEDYTIIIGTSTCDDGIQNGDETGIDCGGSSCEPCNDNEGVIYVDMDDVSVDVNNPWSFFRIEVGDNSDYGAWYSQNSAQLITYSKDVVCNEGSSINASIIGEGVEVGAFSNFVTNPNGYVISSPSYTDWNGKSGYIGFTFLINGNSHYGWFYATVANNGLSYTISEYAYNTNAGESLYTLRNHNKPALQKMNMSKKILVYPNPFSDTTTINLSQLGDQAFIISIYDILGKQVYEKEYQKNPGTLSLGETLTENGNYFVKIISTNIAVVRALVKQ